MLTLLCLFSFFDGATEAEAPVIVQPQQAGGGKRKKRRTIRLAELDYEQRQEAFRDIPVKPYAEIELAAARLAEAEEEQQADDEIVLLALMRTMFH